MEEQNRELALQLAREGRNNPDAPYAGKYVGIAHGQVVVVADSWNELAQRLRQVEPVPEKTFALQVGCDYDAVQEIWGLR